MTINIAFDSFDEMMRYANRLKNGTLFDQAGKIVEEGTFQEPQPEKTVADVGNSVPYGRQIAPHFPNANVSQQPGATSASQQAVPVQQPSVLPQAAQTPAATQPPLTSGAVPTVVHEYTQDDLARAAMQIMEKQGGMQQLQQLLAGYGCDTLQQLPKEQYGLFATALRGMGAQI